MNFARYFARGLSYHDYVDKYGSPADQRRWAASHQRIELTDAQKTLLGGFRREMKVLVMAGAWCGDCVEQCPIFEHFAGVTNKLTLRFVDRDDCQGEDGPLTDELVVCGAPRVPQVVFVSEDDHLVGRYGDRTLSKYRDMAAGLDDRDNDAAGAACPSGIVGPAENLLAGTVQDWLDEFERAQLILRTSARLREKHRD